MKRLGLNKSLLLFLLMALPAIFMLPALSYSAPTSSISTTQIGNLIWDQTEMNIADVKAYASSAGFVSAAEKKGGGLSYESGFVQKPGWTWKMPYGVPASDKEPAVHLNQKEAESICHFYG